MVLLNAMQDTVSLITPYPGLHLRLQAPALTAGASHATAITSRVGEDIDWSATAGAVNLTAVCAPQNDATWLLNFQLENQGPDIEVRLALPYLFYHFDQDQPARAFDPKFGGVLEVSQVPMHIAYPGPASFCMTAAVGLESAVATGVFDAQQRHIGIRHIPAGMDGQIRFVFERILVRQGETLALDPQFICAGRDWAQAMLPYRTWFAAQFKRPRPRPDWWVEGSFSGDRHAHCLAPFNPPDAIPGVWIFNEQGRPRTFEQLKAEVDEAMRLGRAEGFTPLFYQFGWWQNMAELKGLFMFDSLCGDYTEAHDMAKAIIRYIHQQGAKTYLYTNSISAGDESAVYRQQPGLFIRDAAGFPAYNWDYPMLMFCPGAPGMREYWEKALHYILIELDADGIFLDQVCGGYAPQYCYAGDHHHRHPDTYGSDFINLINFIGERARQMKPNCMIAGELVQDSRGILLDEAHGYGYNLPKSSPPAALNTQRSTPPAEAYIFTRYLCPEIYTQASSAVSDLMNGSAGHYREEIWRSYRRVFESTVQPCHVEPAGGLAYLFGPRDGAAILAVRAQGKERAAERAAAKEFKLPEEGAPVACGGGRQQMTEAAE